MFRLYLTFGVALFLFIGWWFVSHSFVFVRLTSVFGLMFVVAAILALLVGARRMFK